MFLSTYGHVMGVKQNNQSAMYFDKIPCEFLSHPIVD